MNRLLLPAAALLLAACAAAPPAEVPIEEAQRRLPKESAVLVAEGCLYRRNLMYVNHFIREESRQLAHDGAKEVIEGFRAYGKVAITQRVVPLMCAAEMPPRGDKKGGRISETEDTQSVAVSKLFPEPMSSVFDKDENLFKAYAQLFAACDEAAYRKERRYDCPLLTPGQAALLKARLRTSYVVALSVGGDRVSVANRSAGALFGVLLGGITIAGDTGTARVRLVNLDTGNLVYSSFPGEFRGQSLAENGLDVGPGRGSRESLAITENWVKRMVKPLFDKQR